MRYRSSKLDVAHAVAPHLRLSDLNSALVAYHALVPYALVLAAVTFPVLTRAENPLTEKTVSLGFQRPVVNCLGFLYLASAPYADFFR